MGTRGQELSSSPPFLFPRPTVLDAAVAGDAAFISAVAAADSACRGTHAAGSAARRSSSGGAAATAPRTAGADSSAVAPGSRASRRSASVRAAMGCGGRGGEREREGERGKESETGGQREKERKREMGGKEGGARESGARDGANVGLREGEVKGGRRDPPER